MHAAPAERDTLLKILQEAVQDMPGCISYVIAKDAAEEHALWITEVWDSKDSHDQSLSLPAVKEAIAKAKPLIAGFEKGVSTIPVGGFGLPRR